MVEKSLDLNFAADHENNSHPACVNLTQRAGTFGEGELPKFERKNHSSKLRVTDSGELFRGKEPTNPNLLVFTFFGGRSSGSGADGVKFTAATPEGKSQGRRKLYKMQ